ncbi:hypothetical protein [Pseudomonas protegens]|uniref:hypothetical protein n=1 Tax=Pseudomonas protegens TaxID=380021 RepID=UPI001B31D596|nr:hypothetical protein [Pseudomonas protegens]MBP5120973.1 hypothetical protein [Pseudomonas protegens]
MNDKMQKEFEVAFCKQFGFGRMAASSNADAAAMLKCAEWAWQSSRESLVVELPNIADYLDLHEQENSARSFMDALTLAIESLGLRVKS